MSCFQVMHFPKHRDCQRSRKSQIRNKAFKNKLHGSLVKIISLSLAMQNYNVIKNKS